MGETVRVERELYLAAPAGIAVYAGNQAYVHAHRPLLVEAVRWEGRARSERLGTRYYSARIFWRLSEDNGATWEEVPGGLSEDPASLEGFHRFVPSHCFEPARGLAVSLVPEYEVRPGQRRRERFSDEGVGNPTRRVFCEVSRDNGRSWHFAGQVICAGGRYDSVHWGPGLHYGRNGGGGDGSCILRRDGVVLHGLTVNLEDGNRYQVAVLIGRWKDDLSGLDWEFSDYIRVGPDRSSQGCCEPALLELPDRRIFIGLRCCGDPEQRRFPSRKFWSVSSDGGRTWSEPCPLAYEDGAPVWSPSSFHAYLRSSKTGRVYLVANILPEPTYSAYPRVPLAIAELDPERLCILRDTVTIVQDLPPGAPEKRRYTNFGIYQERGSGDIILTLPEQPKTSWENFTADCIRYRVRLPD